MARVARDVATGEMKGLWDEAGENETEPDVPDGCEVIDLPDETAFEVTERLKKQAGGEPKKVVFDKGGRATTEGTIPPPLGIAGRIRKARERRGGRPDAPVTLEELEAAENEGGA